MTVLARGPGEPRAEPEADRAFRIEQHGIDLVPESERWATPRDVAAMWAGASVNVEYFVYGAILLGFGFSFAQTISLILLGNLTWLLVGLCSLQGPDTGTTTFGSNRASYGPNGSRVIAGFNWLTQLGFEIEGIILIVGAGTVLASKAGFHTGSPAKMIFLLAAVGIQFLMPFFGHATMVRVLRWLILPFVVIYVAMLAFSASHAHTGLHAASYVNWQLYMVGLAFTITLTGLGWTECGNDYSRYLPRNTPKGKVVGWLFIATALPQIACMVIGALVASFVGTVTTANGASTDFWNGANPFQALTVAHTAIPGWFVVVFMLFALVQLFGINSLDLYSSGVTLQALGVTLKRYQCVLLDSVVCLFVAAYAIFDSSFATYMKDFVDVVIVWIAPWLAVYVVDWYMRKSRYVASELQKTDRSSIYWASGGVNWAAIVAQLLGMAAALSALSPAPPLRFPSWMNPITVHSGGADFSVFMGVGVAGIAYVLLGWSTVRRQSTAQDSMLASGDG